MSKATNTPTGNRNSRKQEDTQNEQISQARDLVFRYGCNATAYQIVNPGLNRWFSSAGDAVVGYVTNAGFRVVAGGPICPRERLGAVMTAFEAEARREGKQVCYVGVQDRLVQIRSLRSMAPLLLLGAQPAWDPHTWPAVLAAQASVRSQVARARNKQVLVGRWPPAHATSHPELVRCLTEWLQMRGLPPLHFLTEPQTLARLEERRTYVASRNGGVVGFLVASPVPARNGWLIEQNIRGRGAPNGTTELLLDTAMHDIAASGATFVTLGLSPFSTRATIAPHPHPPWLRVLLDWARAHGQRFYNFDGLDAYKAKFMPQWWEPIYAMTTEPHISWRTVYAIAGAFGGTSPLWFLVQGAWRALRQEIRWFARRVQHTPTSR